MCLDDHQFATQSASASCDKSFQEDLDGDKPGYDQGDTNNKHITKMKTCSACSHGNLVVLSDDRTFVRIHESFSREILGV
jgi:hypothetical protein